MKSVERFLAIFSVALLTFVIIATLGGDHTNEGSASTLVVLLGSVVIGAAFSWGFHRWPKKEIGFAREN